MPGDVTSGWANFFVAEAGASAGLTGLLFVAVSINLSKIIAFEHLPSRAGETLLILLSVLATSTFGLIPGQSARALGTELLGAWAVVAGSIALIQLGSRKYESQWNRLGMRFLITQFATLPILAAGLLLWSGKSGGLYWLVAAALDSFACGVFNAWVLLIEIQR